LASKFDLCTEFPDYAVQRTKFDAAQRVTRGSQNAAIAFWK